MNWMPATGLRRRALMVVAATLGVAALAAAVFGGKAPPPAQAAEPPPYRDASLPVEQRVQDLLSRMTLEEKVGQMGQINAWALMGDPGTPWDRAPLNPDLMANVLDTNHIGSILSGGGAWPPAGNDAKAWAEMTNAIQHYAIDHSRLGIPIIYGVDAVHGHNNLSNATDFPHENALGATFDPSLVGTLGHRTARAVRATGIQWDFAPVLDTQRDVRWGRSYEPWGEDPFLNGTLGAQFIQGMQGSDLSASDAVAATAKHFTGYSQPDSGLDRTDATISDAQLNDIHLPPFQAGVDAGVATVMINSGSVNGVPAHASHQLLTDVLRNRLHFGGVTVSDWNDVESLWRKYGIVDNMEDAVATAVNAGMDMSMIPLNADEFTQATLGAVAHGKITMARIDQAVSRILTLKFHLGLFEHPFVDANAANGVVEDTADRVLARKAARESLVLLENDGALPLSPKAKRILVTGPASDSPTNQLGGWTIGWQGAFGLPDDVPVPEVTTLREGVEQAAPSGSQVIWRQGVPVGDTTNNWNPAAPVPPDPVNDPAAPETAAAIKDAVDAAQSADAIVVAVGESPYAEGRGDDLTPELAPSQAELVDRLEATGKPVIVVVVAGRPLVMQHQLDEADAALMAFWPGSEGGAAIADTLFGRNNPSGRLTVSWPKSTSQIPLAYNNSASAPYDPRYEFGYGLSYSRWKVTDLRAPAEVSADDTVPVRLDLSNEGRFDGDDSVLAIVERRTGPASAPARQLVAFSRVHVDAHRKRQVVLTFKGSQLAVTQQDGSRSVTPGLYRLVVGDQSRTFRVG
jgi:beta-glucosidase